MTRANDRAQSSSANCTGSRIKPKEPSMRSQRVGRRGGTLTVMVVPGVASISACSWSMCTSPAGSMLARIVWRIPRLSMTTGSCEPSAVGMPMIVFKAFPCSPRVGER